VQRGGNCLDDAVDRDLTGRVAVAGWALVERQLAKGNVHSFQNLVNRYRAAVADRAHRERGTRHQRKASAEHERRQQAGASARR
jgi:hypothetical protein